MRSREFIKEAKIPRIIIQKFIDAYDGLVYILKRPNGDTVRDKSGQTLSYPTKEAAAAARNKMADPSAVQGALDAEKKIPDLMAKAEAGKVGSGSFTTYSVDPSTNKLTQKIRSKDANGKETGQVITKVFDNWVDFAIKTDLWPAGSWRPGWSMAISKIITAQPLSKYFFSAGDILLIGKILNEWRMALDTVHKVYQHNDYVDVGRNQADLDMQRINKEYIIKLTTAVGTIIAANITGLVANKFIGKPIPGGKSTAGEEIANGLVAMFKAAGKKVNPNIVKTLTAGGLEAGKLLAANYAANADFRSNINNAFVQWIINGVDILADIPAKLIQYPVIGDLDFSIGTIGPKDDEIMRKTAKDFNLAPTEAPPPGSPPEGPLDRAFRKFKSL
jgi:hypothetical protein